MPTSSSGTRRSLPLPPPSLPTSATPTLPASPSSSTSSSSTLSTAHNTISLCDTFSPSELVKGGLTQREINEDLIRCIRVLRDQIRGPDHRPVNAGNRRRAPVAAASPTAREEDGARAATRADATWLAKGTAVGTVVVALAWSGFVAFRQSYTYLVGDSQNFGQVILALLFFVLTFGATLWSVYFTVTSFTRMFIPAARFRENSLYLSVVPETKHPDDTWPTVTIQVPVFKENFEQVLLPTLESVREAGRRYHDETDGEGQANVVVYDDGVLHFLKDRTSAFDIIWDEVLSEDEDFVPGPRSRRRTRGYYRLEQEFPSISENDYLQVYHRLHYYHTHGIGFVARSTRNRYGRFKKAGNLNHGIWAAKEVVSIMNLGMTKTYDQALEIVSRNCNFRPSFAAKGDIQLGELIVLNDADSRMAPDVILKTTPEFLNHPDLAFTQHSSKTLREQRDETPFLRMMTVTTDALFQVHFIAGAAMGFLPPLVGHAVFLRTEALEFCGRMQDDGHIVYWSENHISEDFELMMKFYSAGYSGRYVAFADSEFEEGVTRTFDEESGRLRKFSSGAGELVLTPLKGWFSNPFFSALFHRFVDSALPSHYKVHLVAYLSSYFSMSIYLVFLVLTALLFLFNTSDQFLSVNPMAIIIMNYAIHSILGVPAFLVLYFRIRGANNSILCSEFRSPGRTRTVLKVLLFYGLMQAVFYGAVTNFIVLGMIDHMVSRKKVFGATNKDSLKPRLGVSLASIARHNWESWVLSTIAVVFSLLAWRLRDADFVVLAVPTLLTGGASFVVPFIFHEGLVRSLCGCGRRHEDEVERSETV